MIILIKDGNNGFDYEIDNDHIKKYLMEILEEDYNSPDFINLPEDLPVDPYNIGEPYTLGEYVDEYLYELMNHEWYYNYVYDRIMEDFGEEIWEYYNDLEALKKDPHSFYGVNKKDFH